MKEYFHSSPERKKQLQLIIILTIIVAFTLVMHFAIGWEEAIVFFDKHTGASIVILTLILVTLTAWYAIETRRLVQLGYVPFRPVVSIWLRSVWEDQQSKIKFIVVVKNICNYPIWFGSARVSVSQDDVAYIDFPGKDRMEWIQPGDNAEQHIEVPDSYMPPQHREDGEEYRELYAYGYVTVRGIVGKKLEEYRSGFKHIRHGAGPWEFEVSD